VPVQIVELLVLVPGNLKLGRDASHRCAENVPRRREALARPAVRRAVRAVGLPAVAMLVERQGMTVDLSAGVILEDEARGPFDVRATELAEDAADSLDVLGAHAEIEIVVRARLLAQQRVDAPAALDPDVDSMLAQTAEDVDDVGGRQLNFACARSRPSASSVSIASAARAIRPSASSSGVKSDRT
jgi:hypothetical protein